MLLHRRNRETPREPWNLERELNREPRTLDPGTYSHGTLRPEDLLEMFDTIGIIVECQYCRTLADSGLENVHAGTLEWANDVIETLFDHVNLDHTPNGHYFGSIEGDGSDFGIWEFEDTEDEWT